MGRPAVQTAQTTRAASSPAADGHPRAAGPTRVALVGAGFIADFHLEVLRATGGVEVVAVCDADLERAQRAARRFGVPHALDAVAELAAQRIDVAHVLVPPHLHVEVARELIELGISLLVEKPLALSAEDARALGQLARSRGLVLGVNHNAVFHPAFRALAERLERGDIGRIEHVRVLLSVPLRQLDAGDFSHWMFRAPRNIVFEQAVHPFAQVAALAGAVRECRTTILSSRELSPGQVFHRRWLIAGAGERATVEVCLAFGEPFTRSHVEVLGSDGALEADLFHGLTAGERKTQHLDFWNSFLAGWRKGGELKRGARRTLLDYARFTLGFGPRQDAFFASMRDSIRAFHDAFRSKLRPPADVDDAVRVLEWCEAAARGVSGEERRADALFASAPPRAGEIVVLGGTGFIGRRVVAKLFDSGEPVTVVARRAHGLPHEIAAAARDGRARLVRASLEDPGALAGALRGARCVIQLATGGGATWDEIERAMVQGSLAVARACADAAVERFVYVSSTAALYLGADAPRELGDDAPCDPRPQSRALYARGKIAAENALAALHRERAFPLVIVRPAVVVGAGAPFQHSGLGLWVRDNHCVGWGRGDTPLPLVWVDDVADALVRIARHRGSELDGHALSLAADTGLTAREIVAELRRATGRDLHFHPRALALSQAMEVGKWLVKKAGRRKDARFPSWRDLKSRAMVPRLSSRLARDVLGWRPVEERERFLDVAVRVHAPERAARS
jgi:predicted dehydrogenase/nucleoside-diphosphate-sugar epimerase